LPAAADEFFRAVRCRGGDLLERGYSVLVITAGRGTLAGERDHLTVRRGETLLIPYVSGQLRLDGDVEGIRLAGSAVV
jgi:mannose-6-phosphate isomerase